jgi:hypothetical protein
MDVCGLGAALEPWWRGGGRAGEQGENAVEGRITAQGPQLHSCAMPCRGVPLRIRVGLAEGPLPDCDP